MATSSAADIVQAVGGAGNIESLTHCATRLRFQLRDASGVDPATVEAIPGVMGAVPQAGERFQVVIGGGVQNVYNDIMALPEMKDGGGAAAADDDIDAIKARERAKGVRGKVAWIDSLFEFLSDSFRPILGALLGASFFITFMALMATLDVIPDWNAPGVTLDPSWAFINLMWQSVFVFLPLMVAYNATKKVGADPWVGFAIMAVLMLPGFTSLAQGVEPTALFGIEAAQVAIVPIFGIPMPIANYSSQVFPPLLMAAALGPLYKLLRKIIAANLQLIFVPFFAMLIMMPLTAFVIGPIGVYVGAVLAQALAAINSFSPFIFAIVIPLAYPFMVPLGLHWPINAIMLLNIQTLGYDFIQGPMGAWNFACFGATAGVLVLSMRHRDTQMRQTATGALAAGLLGGISEPSLYGIHLRFKRIYPRMLVGCFVGGLTIGIGSLLMGLENGVTTQAFVFTSLLTIPAFQPTGLYAIAIGLAFFTSMFLVIWSNFRTPEQQAEFEAARDAAEAAAAAEHVAPAAVEAAEPRTIDASDAAPAVAAVPVATALLERASIEVLSPLAGTVVPLSEVPDPVFAGGVMGPGAAIEPTGDTVFSPGAGVIAAAQPTGHAFGIVLDGGVELLIHVGIDTVNLKGEGFDVKVKNGDRVELGTPLVTFDRAVIEKAGYPLITPVIVLNADDFGEVTPVLEGQVAVGASLITVHPRAEMK
ncbi:glucose PTS transporter subunit IIA [Microbacterium sp. M3]|uniref:Glucose PTS transporter subunit IIA n=1 Tax=Microbacterium arthrosphaerae TaxID=792652 RepID=A0ABU4H3J8_9MICO|nr:MULTISPECIES: glucose PTS transporter subunit IIA [Microbacterium]MDW4573245.1 glucose PTS transporter subunit IIA [Microbacterium arthrosphaerae]MDW7607100.1 glucose PTS transporter subunit IIA [Microbacterium sp. M3]